MLDVKMITQPFQDDVFFLLGWGGGGGGVGGGGGGWGVGDGIYQLSFCTFVL